MPMMRVDDIACELWNVFRHDYATATEVPKHSPSLADGNWQKGIVVSFDLSVDFYGTGLTKTYRERRDRRILRLAFCGYTNVFMAVQPFFKQFQAPEWSMIASHDSAWRDIRSDVNQVIQEMIDAVMVDMDQNDSTTRQTAVDNLSWCIRGVSIGNLFQVVWINHRRKDDLERELMYLIDEEGNRVFS